MNETARPDDLIQLPDGNWLERFGRPCPECGSGVFTVNQVRRRTGEPGVFIDSVESRCPRCICLGDRTILASTTIGRHDLRAGTLTLIGTNPIQEGR